MYMWLSMRKGTYITFEITGCNVWIHIIAESLPTSLWDSEREIEREKTMC